MGLVNARRQRLAPELRATPIRHRRKATESGAAAAAANPNLAAAMAMVNAIAIKFAAAADIASCQYRVPPIRIVPVQASAVVVGVVQIHPPAGHAARQAAVHAHPPCGPPASPVFVVRGARAVRIRRPKAVLFPALGCVVVAEVAEKKDSDRKKIV